MLSAAPSDRKAVCYLPLARRAPRCPSGFAVQLPPALLEFTPKFSEAKHHIQISVPHERSRPGGAACGSRQAAGDAEVAWVLPCHCLLLAVPRAPGQLHTGTEHRGSLRSPLQTPPHPSQSHQGTMRDPPSISHPPCWSRGRNAGRSPGCSTARTWRRRRWVAGEKSGSLAERWRLGCLREKNRPEPSGIFTKLRRGKEGSGERGEEGGSEYAGARGGGRGGGGRRS